MVQVQQDTLSTLYDKQVKHAEMEVDRLLG